MDDLSFLHFLNIMLLVSVALGLRRAVKLYALQAPSQNNTQLLDILRQGESDLRLQGFIWFPAYFYYAWLYSFPVYLAANGRENLDIFYVFGLIACLPEGFIWLGLMYRVRLQIQLRYPPHIDTMKVSVQLRDDFHRWGRYLTWSTYALIPMIATQFYFLTLR